MKWWICTLGSVAVFVVSACGDDGDAGVPMDSSTPGDARQADGGLFVDSGNVSDGGASTDAGRRDATSPTGGPEMLPTATGTCPDIVDGTVTFSPAGATPRDVRIWISDAADTLDGPLVFYWHGTGGFPNRAVAGLGNDMINAITALGGIVASPSSDATSGTWPWFLVAGTQEDDLLVADEIVACAIESVGIDTSHIHSAGMSAGGIQTTQMSYRRSGYLASVATYSGGFLGPVPPRQDPSNLFAALIFHGGPTDVVVISFQDAGERYWTDLDGAGHFAAICNHGLGHSIPSAQDSVWQFFMDHPWGTSPSPYAGGLPGGFFSACSLSP